MSRSKKQRAKKKAEHHIDSRPPHATISAYERLVASSPVASGSIPADPRYFLKSLLGDGLICVGEGYWNCITESLANISPHTRLGVVVPANMKARYGNKVGNSGCGPRTNDNTGRLKYVVYASESGTLNDQAYSILQLQRYATLVKVVQVNPWHIQGWFSTSRLDLNQLRSFRKRAFHLGALPNVFIDCHPWAVGGGWNHGNNCRHETIYWNPYAL